MATSEPDIKTKIAELRHEILSYKPGKAAPGDDELVVFPDQFVIGMINVHHQLFSSSYNIVHAMRSALHGDVEGIKYADRRETSTKGQEAYLTDHISVTEKTYEYTLHLDVTRHAEKEVENLASRVSCLVVVMNPLYSEDGTEAIRNIKEITGRYPIIALWSFREEDIELERKRMREEGIVEVYEIPYHDQSLSDTEQLQILNLLHGCLREGDEVLENNLNELSTNRRYSLLHARAKKEITEAKQKMTEEIRQHKQVEESLQQEMKKLQMKLEESSTSSDGLVNENARLKNEIVREKEKREQAELTVVENDKMAKNYQEMYKQREAEFAEELKAKEQKIKAQEDKCKEREETARREVERIKKEKEEERGRAAQLTKEVESNQRRVNSLAKLVEEKEQNEASLKQQVNCLKMKIEEERARLEKENLSVELALNELKSEKERVEQLERETWKLRTKIQLESEIRSEERKMKAETSQWSFIPWISSGKQTQTGTSLSEDPSHRGSRGSDEMQAGKELPDDEFSDILKQIADDLYDEAKIDSLGSQLGILQGDIQRALMTNVRFNRVTSEGTRHMLKQWRRGVSREDERIELRRALEAARLLDLAESYLPKELAVEASAPLNPERERRDGEEYDTATKGTKVKDTTFQSDQRDSQQHESVHHVGGVRDDPPSQSVIRDISDSTELSGRLVEKSSAGKLHCSEVAVGAAEVATSSQEKQNQGDEECNAAASETLAIHMVVQGGQEHLRKQDSSVCNAVNDVDIDVADGPVAVEDLASQAYDRFALVDGSDSSSEGRCFSWCCLFRSSSQ